MTLFAEPIARALGGRRSGRGWIVPCVAHDDRSPSLSIADGKNGRLLVKCFAGCPPLLILAELRKIGLSYASQDFRPSPIKAYDNLQKEWSSKADIIWSRTTPLIGSVTEIYLRSRGCRIPDCDDLRFIREYKGHPAMVARVTCPLTNKPFSLHFTFLKPDGSGKADAGYEGRIVLFGHRLKGGVIRLSRDEDLTTGLAIGEGIETSLCCNWLPIWATGNADNIASFPVLPEIECLTIFADHDKAGLEAARRCVARWRAVGREARIVTPQVAGEDWADIAQGNAL